MEYIYSKNEVRAVFATVGGGLLAGILFGDVLGLATMAGIASAYWAGRYAHSRYFAHSGTSGATPAAPLASRTEGGPDLVQRL